VPERVVVGPRTRPGRGEQLAASANIAWRLRRRASAVIWSVPGARPMPRSILPGWSASSTLNCSATLSGAWLGSIIPPEPTRMRSVAAATCPISTSGAELATILPPWCSASQ
jgi:hypothetical protein